MKTRNWFSFVLCCMMMCFVSCTGNDGSGEEPGQDLQGDLVITSSSSFVVADGSDAVTLTVKKGDTDVTAAAKIYMNNAVYSSTTFTTTEPGEYEFFASYEGDISEKIKVKAVAEGVTPLPEDGQPDNFDSFRRRALVIQSTGTWCQFCPLATGGIQEYLANHKEGDAVFAAAHDGDEMSNDYSSKVNTWIGVTTFPTVTMNLDNISSSLTMSTNFSQNASLIDEAVSQFVGEKAMSGIAVAVSGREDTGKLDVIGQVKIGETGQYRIVAWLLEDGIKAEQTVASGIEGDFSTHNNVLRLSSSSKAYGEQLGQNQTLSKGTLVDFAMEMNLNDATLNSLGNCKVAVMVTSAKTGRYVVDNVVLCPINDAVAFEYK